MAGFTPVLAAASAWRVAWWGVSVGFLCAGQAILWRDRSAFRAARRNRPEPTGGPEGRRVKRLAMSGRTVPAQQMPEVQALVDWSLHAWTPRRRIGVRLNAAAIVWWGGLPATFAMLHGKWGVAVALFAFPALVLAVDVPMARQLARMRRTAEVNGWLLNGQVAGAP